IGGAGMKIVQVAFGQFLLAINRPMAALVGTLCGVAVNALAAWILIYGKLGLPPMGIRGSALGQQVGVFVEMTALILLSLRSQVRVTYYLNDWALRVRQFWQLLVVGIPAGAQLVADVLAWSLF